MIGSLRNIKQYLCNKHTNLSKIKINNISKEACELDASINYVVRKLEHFNNINHIVLHDGPGHGLDLYYYSNNDDAINKYNELCNIYKDCVDDELNAVIKKYNVHEKIAACEREAFPAIN